MKQAKSTGALITSLVLAVMLLVVNIIGISTIGKTVYKTVKGETDFAVEETMAEGPSVEAEDPENLMDDWSEPAGDAPVQESNPYALDVKLECITDAGDVYGMVSGRTASGGTWQYYTPYYPVTELEAVQEIAAYEDIYVFNSAGTVVALDPLTGQELWSNPDFGGQSIAFDVDADRTMYLCGYYGPDLCVIDINGNTLDKVEVIDAEFWWPYLVDALEDGSVRITYEGYPESEKDYLVVELGSAQAPAAEAQDWQNDLIAHLKNGKMDKYNRFALAYVDDDGVPEIIGYGNQCAILLKFDPATKEVFTEEFTGDSSLFVYTEAGVFANNIYQYNDGTSETTQTYYQVSENGIKYLGEFYEKDIQKANGEYEFEYKYNGNSVSDGEFYELLGELMQDLTMFEMMFPSSYSADDTEKFLLNWYDASDDEETWKRMLADVLEYRTEYDGYRLQDLNHDGVPELFIYINDEYGGSGCLYVCDVQTHQYEEIYTSVDKFSWDYERDRLYDSHDYGSSASDLMYVFEGNRLLRVQEGFRMMYDTSTEYYIDNARVSAEEYAAVFGELIDGKLQYMGSGSVSYEKIMELLK